MCFCFLKYNTLEKCLMRTRESPYNFYRVPYRFRTREVALLAYREIPTALQYLKDENYEFYLDAVSISSDHIREIDKKHLTPELLSIFVKKHKDALDKIPPQKITKKLCVDAMKAHPKALWFVPFKYKDYQMCLSAIKRDPSVIEAVPRKHLDKTICQIAVDYFDTANGAYISGDYIQKKYVQIHKDKLELIARIAGY